MHLPFFYALRIHGLIASIVSLLEISLVAICFSRGKILRAAARHLFSRASHEISYEPRPAPQAPPLLPLSVRFGSRERASPTFLAFQVADLPPPFFFWVVVLFSVFFFLSLRRAPNGIYYERPVPMSA